MLAAHRDQENVVRSHGVSSKKQANAAKTPAFRNDENAPTAFGGKAGLSGPATRPGGNGKLTVKRSQKKPTATPADAPARAPLGNKTTNAKARTVQADRAKDRVKGTEKTQAKRSHHKTRHKAAGAAPVRLQLRPKGEGTSSDGEEPEHAPAPVAELPYESDVLPDRSLSAAGLSEDKLIQGFYGHFDRGRSNNYSVSPGTKLLKADMDTATRRAGEQTQRQSDELGWSLEDVSETTATVRPKRASSRNMGPAARLPGRTGWQRDGPTISSRRAASALAMASASQRPALARSTSVSAKAARRPLSALLFRTTAAKPAAPSRAAPGGNAAGEAASRTTIGYNKGRAASSLVHGRRLAVANVSHAVPRRHTRLQEGAERELATTPTWPEKDKVDEAAPREQQAPPPFLSIFDTIFDDDDGEDLAEAPLGSDDEGSSGYVMAAADQT